jgi:hypothetical protein
LAVVSVENLLTWPTWLTCSHGPHPLGPVTLWNPAESPTNHKPQVLAALPPAASGALCCCVFSSHLAPTLGPTHHHQAQRPGDCVQDCGGAHQHQHIRRPGQARKAVCSGADAPRRGVRVSSKPRAAAEQPQQQQQQQRQHRFPPVGHTGLQRPRGTSSAHAQRVALLATQHGPCMCILQAEVAAECGGPPQQSQKRGVLTPAACALFALPPPPKKTCRWLLPQAG